MKVKDLDDKVDLSKIKVRLSESLYLASSLPKYDIQTREVYLKGNFMGDFFVKVSLEETQIYPMFNDLLGWNQLKDLEVVENNI